MLLHSGESGNSRDSQTIVSLGSILWKDDIVPILKENSLIPLLLAVVKLSSLQKDVLAVSDNTVSLYNHILLTLDFNLLFASALFILSYLFYIAHGKLSNMYVQILLTYFTNYVYLKLFFIWFALQLLYIDKGRIMVITEMFPFNVK